MSEIVIKFTGNKRQVGILKNSSQQEPMSIKENLGRKWSSNDKKSFTSLKFKCFEKYRSFKDTSDLPKKEIKIENDLNNNKKVSATKTPVNRIWNKVKKECCKITNTHSKGDDAKPNARRKLKRLVTTEREEKIEQTQLSFPYVKSIVQQFGKNLKNEQKIAKDLKSDAAQEEKKSSRKHPNRRLKRERPESDFPVKTIKLERERPESDFPVKRIKLERHDVQDREYKLQEPQATSLRYKRPRSVVMSVTNIQCPVQSVTSVLCGDKPIKQEKEDYSVQEEKMSEIKQEIKMENKHVASEMWENVLDSPSLCEGELDYIHEWYEDSDSDDTGSGDTESVVDYKSMLQEFVQHHQEESRGQWKTPYEQRVDQMLKDPDCSALMKDFYIPPALVEVLHHQITQERTAVDSLRRVCEKKKWPEPEYVCKGSGRSGFLYACTLKTKTFTPARPAANEDLAKELAALECLEWLGFRATSLGRPTLETYFS